MRTVATWRVGAVLVAVGLLGRDLAEASTAKVPEPASLTLLLVAGGAVAARATWTAWRRSRRP